MNRKFDAPGLYDPRILKFLSVGLLNTVFGYAIYAILIFINIHYLTALLVATIAGVVFNYFSFGRIVFHGHAGWLVFGKFVIAYGVVYLVNAALLMALTKVFLFSPYVGQVMCIPLSVILSWLLMNYWVYKKD